MFTDAMCVETLVLICSTGVLSRMYVQVCDLNFYCLVYMVVVVHTNTFLLSVALPHPYVHVSSYFKHSLSSFISELHSSGIFT